MRTIAFHAFALGILLIPCLLLHGQSHIYLDDQFITSSERMEVKRKGLGSIGRYEFGPYKIISGKAGWTSVKERTSIKGGNSNIELTTMKYFVFAGAQSDTVLVNITIASVLSTHQQYGFIFSTLTSWLDKVIDENHESFVARFHTTGKSGSWQMILVYPEIHSDRYAHFRGVLTDSRTFIDIVPVFKWDNGQSASILKPIEGYRFVWKGETIAAVQVFPAHKMITWIKNDLPDHIRTIVAASNAAMMVRSY
jgi:hypothetical protein